MLSEFYLHLRKFFKIVTNIRGKGQRLWEDSEVLDTTPPPQPHPLPRTQCSLTVSLGRIANIEGGVQSWRQQHIQVQGPPLGYELLLIFLQE